jgi:hypothetical protein
MFAKMKDKVVTCQNARQGKALHTLGDFDLEETIYSEKIKAVV